MMGWIRTVMNTRFDQDEDGEEVQFMSNQMERLLNMEAWIVMTQSLQSTSSATELWYDGIDQDCDEQMILIGISMIYDHLLPRRARHYT